MNIIRRPESLDELVGQETIKRKLRIAMGAAMQRGEPLGHVLLTSAVHSAANSNATNRSSESPRMISRRQRYSKRAKVRRWMSGHNVLHREGRRPNSMILLDDRR